jgi:hypothetical protein
VQAWADAWSKQNVDAYLASYAKEFDPPGRMSRADWEKQRRERVSGPKSISVTISSAKVKLEGDAASVTFRQDYRSDRFNGASVKTLEMVRAGGRWLIREEKASN